MKELPKNQQTMNQFLKEREVVIPSVVEKPYDENAMLRPAKPLSVAESK